MRNPACHACRKQKKRCDGIKPVCGLCQRTNRVCEYAAQLNKPGPRQGYLRSLEAEVSRLEALAGLVESEEISCTASEIEEDDDDDDAGDSRPANGDDGGRYTNTSRQSNTEEAGKYMPYKRIQDSDELGGKILTNSGPSVEPAADKSDIWHLYTLDGAIPFTTSRPLLSDLAAYDTDLFGGVNLGYVLHCMTHNLSAVRPCFFLALVSAALQNVGQGQEVHPLAYKKARQDILAIQSQLGSSWGQQGTGDARSNLQFVQTWGLLALYEFADTRFVACTVSCGFAMRSADQLGYFELDGPEAHFLDMIPLSINRIDLNESQDSLTSETRRTAWWCILLDTFIAWALGTPSFMQYSQVQLKLPLTPNLFGIGSDIGTPREKGKNSNAWDLTPTGGPAEPSADPTYSSHSPGFGNQNTASNDTNSNAKNLYSFNDKGEFCLSSIAATWKSVDAFFVYKINRLQQTRLTPHELMDVQIWWDSFLQIESMMITCFKQRAELRVADLFDTNNSTTSTGGKDVIPNRVSLRLGDLIPWVLELELHLLFLRRLPQLRGVCDLRVCQRHYTQLLACCQGIVAYVLDENASPKTIEVIDPSLHSLFEIHCPAYKSLTHRRSALVLACHPFVGACLTRIGFLYSSILSSSRSPAALTTALYTQQDLYFSLNRIFTLMQSCASLFKPCCNLFEALRRPQSESTENQMEHPETHLSHIKELFGSLPETELALATEILQVSDLLRTKPVSVFL